MQEWKQAFWLTKYELKHSINHFYSPLGVLILFVFLFVTSIPDLLENSSGIDIFFLGLIIVLFILWTKPKMFQLQKTGDHLTVSYFLVKLNHLPIKNDVIIKSRLLTYLIVAVPYHGLFLWSLYIFSPVLREHISIGTYAVFSIIWLSYTIFIGCSFPATELGGRILKSIVISALIAPFILILYYIFTKILYKNSVVHFTMFIADSYPFVAIVTSVLLAIGGIWFWLKFMHWKMSRIDYI